MNRLNGHKTGFLAHYGAFCRPEVRYLAGSSTTGGNLRLGPLIDSRLPGRYILEPGPNNFPESVDIQTKQAETGDSDERLISLDVIILG